MTSEGIASPPWQTSYPIFFTPTASYNAPSPTPIAAAADDIALPPSSIPKAALVGSGVAGAVVATAVVATIASKMGCSLLAPLVSVLSFIFKKILGIQKCGEVLSICKGRGKDKDNMYDMDDSENSVRSRRNKHHCDSNCRDCVGDDSLRDQNDSSKLSRSPSVSIDVWEELQVTRKHLHDQANHVGYLLRPTKSNISKFAAAEMRKLEGIRDATASMVINKTIVNDGQDHNIQTVNIGVGKELQLLDQQLIHQQVNDNNLNYNKINQIANSISNQHNSVTINSFEQLQNLTTYKAHDIDVSTTNAKQLQLLEMAPNSAIINSLSPNHAHNPPNLATQTTTPSNSHTSSATTSAHLQLQNVTPEDTGGRHGTVEIDDTSRESKTTTTTTIPAPNLSSNSNIIFIPPSSSNAAAGYSLHHQSHNPIRLVEINAPPKDLQIISAANPSSSSRSDHDHDAAAASGHSQLRRAHNRRNRAPHRSSNSSRRNSKPNNKRKRLISRVAGVRINCEVSAHFMRFFIFCKTGTNYGDDKPRPIDREEEEESLEFDGEDSFRRRRRRRSDVDGGNSIIHMPSDQHQSLTYHQLQLLPQASNHIHGHQNNQNIIGSSSAVTVPSNSTTMVVPLPESAASVGGGGGVSNFFYGQYYNPSTGTYQLIPLLINPVPANYVINNGGGNYGKVAMMSPMPIPQPHHSGVIISDVATLRGGGGSGSGSGGGVNSELTSDTNSLPDKDELPEATATTTTTTTLTKESTKASTTLQIKS